MVDLDKMLELLEEKRQLLLAFEAVTQVMLTCQGIFSLNHHTST